MRSGEIRTRLKRRKRRLAVLGLTGSIGMGKSTLAEMALRMGTPVHDADRTVHSLLAPGGLAVRAVSSTFDGVVGKDGGIDRRALGQRVFADKNALRKLENILHPLVHACEARFLKHMALRRQPVVILDIPLLFETVGELRCDGVCVVTAPLFLRQQRVLRRTGMTLNRLNQIISLQRSEPFRKLNSDFVIQTGLGYRFARQRLINALRQMKSGYKRSFSKRSYPCHA